MLNKFARAGLISAACLLLSVAQAQEPVKGDPEAGKVKAEPCNACHGSTGLSINELWPNLAGQKVGYVTKQLKAFRDGTRVDPFMAQFAKNLSDQDIADLAAHYVRLDGAPPKPAAH